MSSSPPSQRSTVRRAPQRGLYDLPAILAILDAAWLCHVAVIDDGAPIVIPMACWLHEGRLLVHGSPRSRLIERLAAGDPASVGVTHLDGLVLARSAYHHSMNFRSVVIQGSAVCVDDATARWSALEAFVEKVEPGRWDTVRRPSPAELKATIVLAFPLDEASAKVRAGGPVDAPADLDRDVWAGVIPLSLRRGAPEPDRAPARRTEASNELLAPRVCVCRRPVQPATLVVARPGT